jgi:hypothetical protein
MGRFGGAWFLLLMLWAIWSVSFYAAVTEPSTDREAVFNARHETALLGEPGALEAPRVRPAATSGAVTLQALAASGTSVPDFRFERQIISPVPALLTTPEQVMVGDVTGDGRPDVVLTLHRHSSATHILLRIHEQKADGSLADPVELVVHQPRNTGTGLELVDLDGDGVQEIAVGGDKSLFLIRRSEQGFEVRRYEGSVRALYLSAIDADGDGHMDVVAQSWSDGADIHLGDGAGGIREIRHQTTSAFGYNTLATADFTADGRRDLILTNGQGWPRVWVFPFQRHVGLLNPMEIDLQGFQRHPPTGMTVADIDRDGRPDLVVSDPDPYNYSPSVRILYRGPGDSFRQALALATRKPPGALAVADVDGNGYPDIVAMYDGWDVMAVFLQSENGFATPVEYLTDDSPWTNNSYFNKSMVIADANSDGCPDVVLAETSSSLRIFYGRNCRITMPRMSTPSPPSLFTGG